MVAKSYEEIYDIRDAGLVSTGSGMTDLQVAAAAGLGKAEATTVPAAHQC